MRSESTTQEAEEAKNRFPGSTVTFLIPDPAMAKPVISRRLAGRQIDSSAEHPEKASAPILASLEPDSNVRSERFAQSLKQDWEMVSTDAGTQID
jgi:hypothetical protein